MLRHAFLVTGLLIAASCLVAAAEPNGPNDSTWVPASQARTATYRASDGEPAILPVAQPGTPNLADRLKAVREPESTPADEGQSSRRIASSADTAAEGGAAAGNGRSVLIRRGAPTDAETAPVIPPAAPLAAPTVEPETQSAPETTDATVQTPADPTPAIEPVTDDSARRTARRPRRETEGFRSPATAPTAPSTSARVRPPAASASPIGFIQPGAHVDG